MGKTGPTPKRSEERRRRNKPVIPPRRVQISATVEVPDAPGGIVEGAKAWYESLKESGQAQFYEPSDWQAAQVGAIILSRILQAEGVPPANVLQQWTKLNDMLLTTESSRRRVNMEIVRQPDGKEEPKVSSIDRYRK